MTLPHLPSRAPTLMLALAMAATALIAPSAWAHGGEDHGDTPKAAPALSTPAAPRATAQTDSFELVAVMQAGTTPTLMLYLDRADTNAPVEGASIDVESGAFKGTAKAVEPGVYTLPAPALAQAGHHPLTITIQSADTADLMDTTLDVGATAASHEGARPAAPRAASRWPWLAAGIGVLIALGFAWRRLRPASIDTAAGQSTSASKESA